MIRIALIWGNSYDDKPYTTHHTFWEAALKDRPETYFERFCWPDWQKHVIPNTFDLYFFIDFNPCLYDLRFFPELHPRAFFWWDVFHFSFAYPAQITEMFDRSYFAEFNTVDALQRQGVDNVVWLPPAAYEGCYHPIPNTPKKYDFAFIGQPDDTVVRQGRTRKEFFNELQARFPNSIVKQGVYGDDVNQIYNESRILIDRTIYNNVGTRVFETISSGAFLLANKGKVKSGLEKLAIDGHHYVSYDDSLEDCERKMRHYLEHEDERNKIAKAGYMHFSTRHTYSNRMDVILRDFGLC